MEQVFNENSTLGGIVTKFPKAGDYFKEHKIDFCCGGNRPVKEAVTELGLDVEKIVSDLNKLYSERPADDPDRNWADASFAELIDHIVNTHHAYLMEELPDLSKYVTTILRVHGPGHPEIADVHKLFHAFKADMEAHTIKEEADAFPIILKFEQDPSDENFAMVDRVIHKLEEEHDEAGDIMKKIRKVTNDFALPEDACGTYRMVYQRLQEIESDTFQHVHLENNILFPRAMMMGNKK